MFPIQEKVLNEIVDDIKEHGFDHTHPIVLWQGHKSIVLDGHTRLRAAELCGLYEVPIEFKEFSTEEEALEYTIRCQRNRRNLTDLEIVQCISELDKRKSRGGNRGNQHRKAPKATCVAFGKSADETAKVLGINRGKVEKARAVLDKAPDEIKEAVKSGKMSINKAYNKTVKPSESLENSKDDKQEVKKVLSIVKKRLSKEEIQELIKLLQENI
jgi:ParB family chromosome partitioning protein